MVTISLQTKGSTTVICLYKGGASIDTCYLNHLNTSLPRRILGQTKRGRLEECSDLKFNIH